ncbi:MAG: ABC transporter permease [Clostridiales bacterium]|nr:ABC transporter permease [Clostridiales bacterium]
MRERISLPLKVVGTAVILVILFFLFVPYFLPHDPYETSLSLAFLPPGTEGYLLGTDNLGRCILCRILAGGRTTLFSSLCVVFIVFLAGTALGTVSGYAGGKTDVVIGKITTVFQAFPGFVLAVAIAGILGQGLLNGILSLSLVYWTIYARLSRSLALTLKDAAFVRSARLCGAGTVHILTKYILPELLPPMIITAAMDIGMVTLSMAGLSFIGLGPARPTAEWGAMMSESRSYLQTAPWMIIFPGIALFGMVLLFNLFGDFLRDHMEKRNQTCK